MVTFTYDERGFGCEDDINYGNMFKVLLKKDDARIILIPTSPCSDRPGMKDGKFSPPLPTTCMLRGLGSCADTYQISDK